MPLTPTNPRDNGRYVDPRRPDRRTPAIGPNVPGTVPRLTPSRGPDVTEVTSSPTPTIGSDITTVVTPSNFHDDSSNPRDNPNVTATTPPTPLTTP